MKNNRNSLLETLIFVVIQPSCKAFERLQWQLLCW